MHRMRGGFEPRSSPHAGISRCLPRTSRLLRELLFLLGTLRGKLVLDLGSR